MIQVLQHGLDHESVLQSFGLLGYTQEMLQSEALLLHVSFESVLVVKLIVPLKGYFPRLGFCF